MENDLICFKIIKKKVIIDLIVDGLLIDGGHHKQYYLEKLLGYFENDIEGLKKELELDGYVWESGIAP